MGSAVVFDHVGKRFRRGEVHDSLRDLIGAGLRRLRGRSAPRSDRGTFWALRDVCFEAAPGEALGIIGPNGAGKSTALKLLAGILRCDEGRMEVNGRLAALIEINAGMHGDLTGLENIHLNAAIMGMSRREIRAKLDDIIAFSGLEQFIHTPVKRYSTGMQARLGFSTAAHISPDVLLVDEVLSVGDAAFRHRCEQRMSELVRNGTTLVFVTHNLEQMRKICHRTVVLEGGRCVFQGDPAAAVDHYLRATMNVEGPIGYADQRVMDGGKARVTHVTYHDKRGRAVSSVKAHEPVRIVASLRLDRRVKRLGVIVNMRRMGGELFVSLGSARSGTVYDVPSGDVDVSLELPSLPFASGTYWTQVRLWDEDACCLLSETPYRFPFQVDDGGLATGMLSLPHTWRRIDGSTAGGSGDAGADEVEPCDGVEAVLAGCEETDERYNPD